MLKKICFFAIFATTSLFSMIPDASQAQLNHIRTQLNRIKREWNTARIHIKQAKKASPTLYAKIQPIMERMINSTAFTTAMEADVTNRYDTIVNANGSFVKIEYMLSTFSKVQMQPYGQNLFSAMAAKKAYNLLAKKLVQKIQNLTFAIKTMQQQPQGPAYVQ